MKTESLIFDVDGTLWDSVALVAKGWNRAFQEAGLSGNHTADGIRPLFGKTMDEIASAVLPNLPPERRREVMDSCMDWENRVMWEDPCHIFYPQVRETLERLAERHRLFIVSNCHCGYIELLLAKGDLAHLIADHLCFGQTGTCKAQTIRTLMERDHVESAVYIGDTQGDLDAARGAGIPFVWASYGFGAPESWDAKIGTFAELTELF